MERCRKCNKKLDPDSFYHFTHEGDCEEYDLGICICDVNWCPEHCPVCEGEQ